VPDYTPRWADGKIGSKSVDRKRGPVETEDAISAHPSRMTNTVVITYNPRMHGTAKVTMVQNLKY
jgi:hypothetical protein